MAINPALLASLLQQAPRLYGLLQSTWNEDILNNFNELLQDRQYDPGLMQNTVDDTISWLDRQSPDSVAHQAFEPADFVNYKYWDDLHDRHNNPDLPSHSEGILSTFGLNEISPRDNKLNGLMADLDEMRSVTKTDYTPDAAQSAISMLQANPKIGLPNDPMMLPYEDPMTGLAMDNTKYRPTPRGLFEGAAYNSSDFTDDDNPDDKLAKLARMLIRGGR